MNRTTFVDVFMRGLKTHLPGHFWRKGEMSAKPRYSHYSAGWWYKWSYRNNPNLNHLNRPVLEKRQRNQWCPGSGGTFMDIRFSHINITLVRVVSWICPLVERDGKNLPSVCHSVCCYPTAISLPEWRRSYLPFKPILGNGSASQWTVITTESVRLSVPFPFMITFCDFYVKGKSKAFGRGT